jgi:hypothetical protein
MPAHPLEEEHVSLRKLGIGAAIVTASAAIVVGGSALANAAARSAGAVGAVGYSVPGYGAPGYGAPGYGGTGGHARGGGQGGQADTPVTGAELTKVTDAMKAKDSAVTVGSVQKDPDGSYDVYGTKAGAKVAYDVSADLETFTARTGGPGGGGRGGHGGSPDTPVTGSEATSVTDAVKAKDPAVTVTSVRKDPDGSYDVLGTKAGAPVLFEVSKDLKTITQNSFTGRQGRGPQQPQQQTPAPNA